MITEIDTSHELDAFRNSWGGWATLNRLREAGGRLLVRWPVGIGKSCNIDDVIEWAIYEEAYDCVLVLCPTHEVITERRFIRSPPGDISVRRLQPRPRTRCGGYDTLWASYETRGLGGYAREVLCGSCPSKKGCRWVHQYGVGLRGTQVLYATQAHLALDPHFVGRIRDYVGCRRLLVVLDEDKFMFQGLRKQITREDLKRFQASVERVAENPGSSAAEQWRDYVSILCRAGAEDLRTDAWEVPPIHANWALAVQRFGERRYPKHFNFLGYDLQMFGRSDPATRELGRDGSIRFTGRPDIPDDLIVYSATTEPELLYERLGVKLDDAFADYRFVHPGTRWYNIRSNLGALRYFNGNEAQILDFFAFLIAARVAERRRPLIVTRKPLREQVALGLQKRLVELGVAGVRIVTGDAGPEDLLDPRVIPVIHYGMVGTNRFQNYDCCYCVSAYNVHEDAVNELVQGGVASADFVPLTITASGLPRTRQAGAARPGDEIYDAHRLAPAAHRMSEGGVVVQAVGRVRPFTTPCEVITFQCGDLPGVKYDGEFASLDQARAHFGVPTRREFEAALTRKRVTDAKAEGLKQQQAAERLHVSRRTVQVYWHDDAKKAQRTLIDILLGFTAPFDEPEALVA